MTRTKPFLCSACPSPGHLRVTTRSANSATLSWALHPAHFKGAAPHAAGRFRRGSSAKERVLYKGEAGGLSPSPVANFSQQGRATEAHQPHKLKVAGSIPAPAPSFNNPVRFKEESVGVPHSEVCILRGKGNYGGIVSLCEPTGQQRPTPLYFPGHRFAAGSRKPQGPHRFPMTGLEPALNLPVCPHREAGQAYPQPIQHWQSIYGNGDEQGGVFHYARSVGYQVCVSFIYRHLALFSRRVPERPQPEFQQHPEKFSPAADGDFGRRMVRRENRRRFYHIGPPGFNQCSHETKPSDYALSGEDGDPPRMYGAVMVINARQSDNRQTLVSSALMTVAKRLGQNPKPVQFRPECVPFGLNGVTVRRFRASRRVQRVQRRGHQAKDMPQITAGRAIWGRLALLEPSSDLMRVPSRADDFACNPTGRNEPRSFLEKGNVCPSRRWRPSCGPHRICAIARSHL